MRICFPITNLTFEGNVVFDLVKELSKQGEKVKLVVPHAPNTPIQEKIEGIEIRRFRYFWPSKLETLAYGTGIVKNIFKNPLKVFLLPFFFAAFSAKIFSEAKACDVIHAQWLPSAIAALPAKILLKKPVVLTVHGTDVRNIPMPLVWLAVKASNTITTSHEGLLERVRKAGGSPKIVRNMVCFDSLKNPKNVVALRKEFSFWNKPVILFVGRFIEERDPDTFIKAAKLLPEANFVMVGDGRLFNKAKVFASKINAKNVFFVGRRKEVASFLKLSSVFVSTANFDNAFSSAVVEAAIAEKPMVLTRVGKTSKFFNEKNSVLFEAGNEKQLADALKGILKKPNKAKEIARNGRLLVKQVGFDKQLILQKNKEIYRKLVGL